MKTITLQIGNSDNKLTQEEWSKFVEDVNFIIHCRAAKLHFFGGSENWKKWQNVAWIFEIEEKIEEETLYLDKENQNLSELDILKRDIIFLRSRFEQDSVAWIVGNTEFV